MRATIILTIILFLGLSYAVQDNSMTQVFNPQLSGAELSIPKSINFQGYLYRDGTPMDTTMNMWFSIYTALSGGSLLFQQTTNNVEVINGWFTVSLDNIPNSVFPVSGPTRYLEVKAPSTGPALEPRFSLVSVGYSYHSITADSAETANDIKDGAVTMAKINTTGSTAGQTITSTGSGTVPNWSNPTPAPHDHLGETWTTTTDDIGLTTVVDRDTSSTVYGRIDSVVNSGTGGACGGHFWAGGTGTGAKTGVYTYAIAPSGSDNPGFGIYSDVDHDGTGDAFAGRFSAYGSGAGDKYGVYSDVCHDGTGEAYGGYFKAFGSGFGWKNGVWSEAISSSSSSGSAYGFYGAATHDGTGFAFGGSFHAYGQGHKYGVYSYVEGAGTNYAGYFNGDHVIIGSKSAAVKIGKDDWRLLYCQESPELWFEDFGEGQLNNGQIHIKLDPIFLKTVTISTEHPIKVFVQLDDNCNGVYVKRGNSGFDVIELQNGKSNAQFTYRVVAKRAGYENLRLKKMEPGTNPEELKAEHDKMRKEMERERNKTK